MTPQGFTSYISNLYSKQHIQYKWKEHLMSLPLSHSHQLRVCVCVCVCVCV